MIKAFFGAKPPPLPSIPIGERVYAVGDIHGELDRFEELLAAIEADDRQRGPASTSLILLGDLIDRGPNSCGVVQRAMTLETRWPRFAYLMGNHEEILLAAADGDRSTLALFDRVGGQETLLSYGVDSETYYTADLRELAEILNHAIPAAHLDFLASGLNQVTVGDYLFVHAGIRPKVALTDQRTSDLRWIREPFLSDKRWHGAMIVHGHSITAEPDVRLNRIGIDTGAYRGGRLTAIGLEGTDRWFLST